MNTVPLNHFPVCSLEQMLDEIPNYNIWSLIRAASYADHAEKQAFRVRGACFVRLRERIEPLPGGRGKRDLDEVGRQALLRKIAARIGADYDTLSTDARIHTEFFTDTALSREFSLIPLPRRFYVIALGTPDKVEALQYAIKQRALDPHYSCMKFRAYVKGLQEEEARGTERGASHTSPPKKVTLSCRARRLLAELWQREELDELSASAVVTLALLRMHDDENGSGAYRQRSARPVTQRSAKLMQVQVEERNEREQRRHVS